MMHGYTAKHCYHCMRTTAHKIVETDGLKVYICQSANHLTLYGDPDDAPTFVGGQLLLFVPNKASLKEGAD